MPETRKYTVVDLFAGVGGLSYGFSRNEHYEIILANEMQKDIAKAYTLNHPAVNMLQGDIIDLSEDVLRQTIGNRTVDVVVGGPPCQSYSTLGKRQMDAWANVYCRNCIARTSARDTFCHSNEKKSHKQNQKNQR